MRYIIFYDIDFKKFDSVIACDRKRRKQGESIPAVLPPHMMAISDGTLTGFSILDADNEEQIAKYIIQYGKAGKKNMQAYPIWPTSMTFDIWETEKKRTA